MSTILIIEDDDQLRKSFEKLLLSEGYQVVTAASGESGLYVVKKQLPDLVVLDVRLPGMNGLETFKAIHDIAPKLQVIIMTAFGTTDTAIEATKLGAYDYVLKPFEIPEMLNLIARALDTGRFMSSPVELNATPDNLSRDAMIGRSSAMQQVYKAIGHAAPTNATVLIRGESGTGKELVARALYQHSAQSGNPFIVINCVAIPDTLLESELFGYEKGAFTGAAHRRIGKIEQAKNGTIFLDEIGDTPIHIQAKLLRLLQEKNIERLGGRESIPVNVRIIAATNRNLEKAIDNGSFREDLYYRLKVVTILLPPLRERKEDIPLLAEYVLSRHAHELKIPNPGISEAAKNQLCNYSWPGNIRELSNILQKTLIFNQDSAIDVDMINQAICESGAAAETTTEADGDDFLRRWVQRRLQNDADSDPDLFNSCVDSLSRILTSEALVMTDGNRSKAAKLLGLSRPTLHSKIDKYHLQLKTTISG
ncbi:MAG: sigma-54 dependent transcriptional regulator [bacterium]